MNNTGKNYKSLLVGNELDASSESEIMSSKKIRILATEYTYEKIQKNGYDDLIVLIEPDTEDAKIIEGYTISGMPISVSSISEPKNPVIIVGYCEICNDEQTNKLSNEPTIPQSNLRRTNGYAERVTWVHIPNLSSVESWWDGMPEMKITAICYNQNTSMVDKVKDSDLGGNSGSQWNRSKWEAGINFASPEYFGNGLLIFNWYFTQWHGTTYLVKIWEYDGDGGTLTLVLTTGGSTFTYTGIRAGDDQLDEQQISHPDPTPRNYNTGVLNYTIDNVQ